MFSRPEAEAIVADKVKKSSVACPKRMTDLLRMGWPAVRVRGGPRRSSYLDRLVGTRALCRRTQSLLTDGELWSLALTDELTGVLNRRGFLFLAWQQLMLAARNGCGSILFYCDLDQFKHINDRLGHETGDQALVRSARLLEKTFRKSDIVARFGGDEFVALALETKGRDEITIEQRLRANLKNANAVERRYLLSLSIGVARSFSGRPDALPDLISRADRNLYAAKCRTLEMAKSYGSAD
jgi:diguanylate cyclase (GGDEF)-like protein